MRHVLGFLVLSGLLLSPVTHAAIISHGGAIEVFDTDDLTITYRYQIQLSNQVFSPEVQHDIIESLIPEQRRRIQGRVSSLERPAHRRPHFTQESEEEFYHDRTLITLTVSGSSPLVRAFYAELMESLAPIAYQGALSASRQWPAGSVLQSWLENKNSLLTKIEDHINRKWRGEATDCEGEMIP